MKNITLVVVGGDVEAKEIPLDLPATIGRGRDASVSLTHPLVSRKHCEIIESHGRVLVRDLESLNGTFVGSERVAESILHPGDLLTVGTVTFRAVYQESELNAKRVAAEPEPNTDPQDPSGGTADLRRPDSDTLRVDSPRLTPTDSEPSDTPHPAEYDT